MALSITAVGHAQPRDGRRLVCWQDDAGRRACGDSIPPQHMNKKRIVLDSAGRTVKVIPGTLTPEERAAQEARAREEAAAKRMAEQQAAYDRALLATYSKPQELAALRDDRLAALDTRIELSESAARRTTVSVAELRTRLPEAGSSHKADPRLLKQIADFEEALASTQHSLAEQRRKREALCASFEHDIKRFQELKFPAVIYNSPCPPPGSLTPENRAPLAGP